jgi:hypothetical protein
MDDEDSDDCNLEGQEIGHNALYTGFTGTTTTSLSGHSLFPFPCSDSGLAGSTRDMEL